MQEWAEYAWCAGHPLQDYWTSDHLHELRIAATECLRCPVIKECRAENRSKHPYHRWHVWGGEIWDHHKQLRNAVKACTTCGWANQQGGHCPLCCLTFTAYRITEAHRDQGRCRTTTELISLGWRYTNKGWTDRPSQQ